VYGDGKGAEGEAQGQGVYLLSEEVSSFGCDVADVADKEQSHGL
jgi:hypothetical protein